MGDLSRVERGQLLLAAAIGIGVLLVVLAVLLNTAIYTEAAAGSAEVEAHERAAHTYLADLERAGAGVLDRVNRESDAAMSHDEAAEVAGRELAAWAELRGRHVADDGAAVNVTVTNTTAISRVVHDDGNRSFTDANGSTEWTVAANASGIRSFRMTVRPAALYHVSNGSCGAGGGCFQVIFESAQGEERAVYIYRNNTSDVRVAVETNEDVEECSPGNGTTRIDLVNGTIDGVECPSLGLGAEPGPEVVRYANGENITGRYVLEVDARHESPSAFATNASPRVIPGVGSAEVRIAYRSRTLTLVHATTVSTEGTDV